jgi:hypothetical protein
MSTSRSRGGTNSLDEIRADLENRDLTMTQRKHAFRELQHWLADHPDDETARKLLGRHEAEFGREPAPAAERVASGEGFGAIGEAERRVEGAAGTAGERRP